MEGDDGFVRAALFALDEKRQAHLDVARLLPALRTLVAGRSTAQQRAVAAAGVESWLSEHEARIQKRGTAVVPDRCGFLAKTTRSGVSASVRWVVLEGAVLSYFADRAETDLRGVLRLSGATCSRYSGFHARRHLFQVAAVPGTGSFNALHAGKSAYVFAASSEEDAGAWVGAINAAIARSESDLPPRPVLSVDGSWARVQLRAAWERDASPGDGSSLVTTGRGPDPGSPAFAAHASASAASSGGFTSAYHAGAMAGSPRRGGMGQRATSEGSTTAAVLAAAARIEPRATARMPFAPRLRVLRSGGDEGMERTVRAAERAVAEAAAAASRRLWGFQPGDRASLHQLSVDVGRDCTVVQGVPMAAARLESLVRAVVGAVRQAAAAATTGAGASPPGDEGEVGDGGRGAAGEGEGSDEEEDCGEEARLPGGGVPSSALERVAGEDARLMEFASDVLSGSCRTVAGGDAYEALELAMRCPGAAVIVPQSDLASPVVLTAVGAGGTYTPPPVRVLPLTAAAEGADTAGLTIATEALSSREEEDAARAQGVERGRGAAFVVADTCVFYRIKASDMQTDEEQDAEDDEPPAAGAPAPTGGDRSFSDDESDGEAPDAAPVSLPWQRGDVAFVAAHYRRVFPLGSFAGNGTVRVYAVARRGGGDRAGDA